MNVDTVETRGLISPGHRVRDGCGALYLLEIELEMAVSHLTWGWEQNLDPLQEKYALQITKPTLQPFIMCLLITSRDLAQVDLMSLV